MPIKFGTTSISSIYKGNTKIDKIYKGLDLVYQSNLLPSGYTLCEYLESDGNQYINTGLYMTQDNEIIAKASLNNATIGDTNNSLCGSRKNTGDNFYLFYARSTSSKYRVVFQIDGENNLYENDSDGTDAFTFKMNKTGSYINDTLVYSYTSSNFTSTIPFYVCGGNNRGRAIGFVGRSYSYIIKENNNVIMKLIPCLDTNGTPCMYDVVGKQTYYNAGTGTFNYG